MFRMFRMFIRINKFRGMRGVRTAGLGIRRSMRRARARTRDRNWFNKCVIGALQELRSIVLVFLTATFQETWAIF